MKKNLIIFYPSFERGGVTKILINLLKIVFPETTTPNIKNIIIKIGVEINIQVGKYNLGKYFML